MGSPNQKRLEKYFYHQLLCVGILQRGLSCKELAVRSLRKDCSLKTLHAFLKSVVLKKKRCCSIFSSRTFPFSDHYVLHSDLWELREDRIGMSGLDICRYDYEQVYLSKE